MKSVVVNCSSPHYNLGARKCFDWLQSQGQGVAYYDGDPGMWELDADSVYLSCIFSWHAPIARQIALRMKTSSDVYAGGPGLFALAHWWKQETGLEVTKGLDSRFDKQRGFYDWTFAARGCPVGCSFCIVPQLEGRTFTFDPDFVPAPKLGDNNLSALPAEYQQHIIDRYRAFGVKLIDANSGFEPRYFTEETHRRWKSLLDETHAPWRFAYDEALGERGRQEREGVERMLRILKDVPSNRKRVYCLVGNEPIEVCYERAQRIIELGGEPHCQFVLPLNLLDNPYQRDPSHVHVKLRTDCDWTSYRQGKDFCRYYNLKLWRKRPLWDYNNRKGEQPPFAFLKPMQEVA